MFAVRRVGSESAKDVVSETFEVAWRNRMDFPTDRAAWAGWVVGIAKNKVLQELQRRTRKHHDNRYAEDWASQSHTSVQDDVTRLVIDSLEAQFVYSRLTPAEQQLFDIAFLRDLGPDDGAQVLGISPSAFTSRVNRLRQRLRSMQASGSLDPTASTGSGGPPV